jgi:hypothetical protein
MESITTNDIYGIDSTLSGRDVILYAGPWALPTAIEFVRFADVPVISVI